MQQPTPTSTCILLEPGLGKGTAGDQVRAAAARLGIHVRSGEAVLEAGRSRTDSLTRAIKSADCVVAVISAHTTAQSWFEVGLAAAVGRSVLLVLDGVEPGELPASANFRTVGPLLAPDALERALRRAIKPRPKPSAPASRTGTTLSDGRWSALSASLAQELMVTPAGGANAARYEAWFGELLSAVDVPFTTAARVPDAEPAQYDNVDFAISAAELSPNLGDPMPVELVLGPVRRVLRARVDSFDKYLAATGATTLLVVTLVDDPPGIRGLSNGEVLWVSASRLLNELRHRTFGLAVLELRNRAIDSPGVD